jgi:CRP-like cAMP-binding protein
LESKVLAIKGWFKGGTEREPREDSIDDLIVLERYEEAGERLRAKLKAQPHDLHSHLKLAEVYSQLRQFGKAVDEFSFVAEEYAQDGFYDKGMALLSKAAKLAPLDETLRFKMERLQRQKNLEQTRSHALDGLKQTGEQTTGTSALELQRLWPKIAGSAVVQRLPADQLQRLFSAMQIVRYEAGRLLAQKGSREGFLVLLATGVVETAVDLDGRRTTLRSFGSGDVIGEAALLERGEWPADYRTTEPVTALLLNREGLEKALVGCSDPRGFLETLRGQHHDREVAVAVYRLSGKGA